MGAAHPLVDGPVLAAGDGLIHVEPPHGRAGVDAELVDHAVDGDVLAGPHRHHLGDVAHLCRATAASVLSRLPPCRQKQRLLTLSKVEIGLTMTINLVTQHSFAVLTSGDDQKIFCLIVVQ